MYAPRSLNILNLPTLRAQLARRCPFYYGWVVFAIAASTSYAARPLMSVAVLSVFMVPMTMPSVVPRAIRWGCQPWRSPCRRHFPLVGRLIDRYGSGWMIAPLRRWLGRALLGCPPSARHGPSTLCIPGRMVFASPLELATSTAISNWFIRRRSFALALLG
jgi:hypothetical protein